MSMPLCNAFDSDARVGPQVNDHIHAGVDLLHTIQSIQPSFQHFEFFLRNRVVQVSHKNMAGSQQASLHHLDRWGVGLSGGQILQGGVVPAVSQLDLQHRLHHQRLKGHPPPCLVFVDQIQVVCSIQVGPGRNWLRINRNVGILLEKVEYS